MRALGFYHLSINAPDMEKAVRFYEEVFGMERIPAYNFGFKTQYLRCGSLQLHVFQLDDHVPVFQHFAIGADDFHAVYERARELGVLDSPTFRNAVNELPDGSVQMYLRDPGGNLVEVDWPDVSALDKTRIPDLKPLTEFAEQSGEAVRASPFYDRPHLRADRLAGGKMERSA
jgi:catechol 2,3-dioxygenase-like lactoylglutathione lyase family enzyme